VISEIEQIGTSVPLGAIGDDATHVNGSRTRRRRVG
jgi:hypothetical protein